MTLGPKTIAAIGAAVATAISSVGAVHTGNTLEEKLDKVLAAQVDQGKILTKVESDVRLLKCDRDFPGDCPGQARRR